VPIHWRSSQLLRLTVAMILQDHLGSWPDVEVGEHRERLFSNSPMG
jgi:hypothetical protein